MIKPPTPKYEKEKDLSFAYILIILTQFVFIIILSSILYMVITVANESKQFSPIPLDCTITNICEECKPLVCPEPPLPEKIIIKEPCEIYTFTTEVSQCDIPQYRPDCPLHCDICD